MRSFWLASTRRSDLRLPFRHSLQVKNADIGSKVFVFVGGSEFFKLDEKWDNTAAWAYLENNRSYLEELAEEHGVDVYDLCLGKKLLEAVWYQDLDF